MGIIRTRREAAEAFAARVLPLIQPLQAEGKSLRSIAETLNAQGVATARGGRWAVRKSPTF